MCYLFLHVVIRRILPAGAVYAEDVKVELVHKIVGLRHQLQLVSGRSTTLRQAAGAEPTPAPSYPSWLDNTEEI